VNGGGAKLGIIAYALAVVGALTVTSAMALHVGLALDRRGRSRAHSGHPRGGRVLSPTASSGRWSEHHVRVGTPSIASRADALETARRRPLTADQQATRDAWARWRAEQGK
jgi:hypothetical protein